MTANEKSASLSDFLPSPRIAYLTFLALVLGVVSSFVAIILMKTIGFFTNLFFYHRLSLAFVPA